MTHELRFFMYLIEYYAAHKNMPAGEVLQILQDKNLVDIILNSYEIYHIEAIENAFMDIDSLIETGHVAY